MSVEQPFRVAVVGCGRISQSAHVPAVLASTRAQLTALVDPVLDRAQELATRFHVDVRTARSVSDVLADVDGIIIATPNHTHCALALECLHARVPVLIEKPLATRMEDGEAIVRASRERNTTVAVGYCTRFFANVPLMRTLIADRYFGTIRRFAYQFGARGGWAALSAFHLDRQSMGGGVLVGTGTHFLDRLLYWFGIPDSVSLEHDSDGGPDANAVATFRYSRGAAPFEGVARFSRTVNLARGFAMETDRGVVVLREGADAEIEFHPNRGGMVVAVRPQATDPSAAVTDNMELQLEDFIDACRLRRPPVVPAEQGLDVIRLTEALYANASTLNTNWYAAPQPVFAES